MRNSHYGFVAAKVEMRSEELGISRTQLAARVGFTYETVRKVMTAEMIPTDSMLHAICAVLDLPFKQLSRLAQADRALRQCGPVVWTVFGKNPRFAQLYIWWEYLTNEQQDDSLAYCRFLAERRRAKLGAPPVQAEHATLRKGSRAQRKRIKSKKSVALKRRN